MSIYMNIIPLLQPILFQPPFFFNFQTHYLQQSPEVHFNKKKKKEMAFNGKSRVAISFTLFTILFTLSTLQCGAAMRPLHGEQLLKKHFPLIESLQRGPVPPSKGSPGTHIPDQPEGSGTSKLNEMNFVGRANRQPPPAFPSSVPEQSKASN